MKKGCSVLAGFCLSVLAHGSASAAKVGPGVIEAVSDGSKARVVVALREPTGTVSTMGFRAQAVAQTQGGVLHDLGPEEFELTHRWEMIPGVAGWVTSRGLEKLIADPDVLQIDLDAPARAHMAEAVTLVHADEVQALGSSGRGVTVAVLDTGIDTDHADFAGRIADQACFCTGCCRGGANEATGAGSAEDDNGHGTNVAGVIAGGGAVAPRGMAPEATLVALKVLDANGSGSSTGILSGLDYVLKSRPEVRIVNLSLGLANLFPGNCDSAAAYTTGFASAINSLRARGTITFASSGNQANAGAIAVPACIGSAVSVGAVYDDSVGTISFGCTDGVTSRDMIACFSNSSSALDLLAPGAPSTAAGVGGGTSTFIGTSQACPAAAGAAALLLSASPGAGPDKIEQALKGTGITLTDSRNGVKVSRINVRAALDAVR